jgi:signal recognition particle receptor subunit beta
MVKETTTVGIEYGVFTVCDDDIDVVLLLFGTPGQERFSDVREVAAQGLDGLIVLVDGNDRTTWQVGAELYNDFNAERLIPTVVVVNRWPEERESPEGLTEAMRIDTDVGIVHGHVIDTDDARRFLIELLSAVLEKEVGDDDRAMEVA